MTVARIVPMLLMALTAPLAAQEGPPEKRPPKGDLPPVLKNTTRALTTLFNGPLHLVVDGVASGGGIAGGVGAEFAPRNTINLSTKALYSVRQYWLVEGVARYEGRRTMVEGYARARDLTQVAFHGLGMDTRRNDRTSFASRENVVGANGSFRVAPGLTVLGRVEQMQPNLRPGRAASVHPSIETLFTEADAPGLDQQPRFGRYETALQFGIPASVGEALMQGTDLRVTYDQWVDQQLDQFSFTRVEFEARQRFAGPLPHHRLTLRGWVSTTETKAGQEVPFYLQRTLGGKGELKSVHEHQIGLDGSEATLRGYNSFRYRGRHLLLLQAEYRVPVWKLLDASVFVDAGKVTTDRADLDLNGLKGNYGFSLSLMRASATAARVDVGLGGEGIQLHFSISAK